MRSHAGGRDGAPTAWTPTCQTTPGSSPTGTGGERGTRSLVSLIIIVIAVNTRQLKLQDRWSMDTCMKTSEVADMQETIIFLQNDYHILQVNFPVRDN